MKELMTVFKSLYDYSRSEPREFWMSITFLSLLVLLTWAGLWFAAVLEGRV